MHLHPFVFRTILRDISPPPPATHFVRSPFRDRDTLSINVLYYGSMVDTRFKAYCRLLLQRMRQCLKGEVRVRVKVRVRVRER